MENSAKKQINLRLKNTILKELQSLSKKHRVSQAGIVAILIHWLYTDGQDVEKLEEAFDTAEAL
jgi:hypothetical protein